MENNETRKNEYIFWLILAILGVSIFLCLLRNYSERKIEMKNKTVFILESKEEKNMSYIIDCINKTIKFNKEERKC